jgi:hypothetical protein
MIIQSARASSVVADVRFEKLERRRMQGDVSVLVHGWHGADKGEPHHVFIIVSFKEGCKLKPKGRAAAQCLGLMIHDKDQTQVRSLRKGKMASQLILPLR